MMMPLREEGIRHEFPNVMKRKQLEEIRSEEKMQGKSKKRCRMKERTWLKVMKYITTVLITNENISEEKIRKIMKIIKISIQKAEEELLSMGEVVDIFTLQSADHLKDNSLKGIISKFQEMKLVRKSTLFE